MRARVSRVARVVGGERVQRAVVVERVQREHPLQVDRVVLRREVEQVAEAVERRLLELLRARAVARASPVSLAQHRLRVDQRRLDVVDRRRVDAAAGVQPVGGLKPLVLRPREELARLAEGEARAGLLVEQRRQQRVGRRAPRRPCTGARCSTRSRRLARVPAGGRDVAQRALGVCEPAARAGRAVGVDEREAPPAVVVEPRLGVRRAVARVGRVARAAGAGRGSGSARRPRRSASSAARLARVGCGDRDRVERLEQRHDVPDRRQRIAFAIVQARVVPARRGSRQRCSALRDAGLRERQVVLLGGRQRRARGRRERGADAVAAQPGASASAPAGSEESCATRLRTRSSDRARAGAVATVRAGDLHGASVRARAAGAVASADQSASRSDGCAINVELRSTLLATYARGAAEPRAVDAASLPRRGGYRVAAMPADRQRRLPTRECRPPGAASATRASATFPPRPERGG